MVAMLSIIIGIVFVMLLFSLLATSIMELLAGLFSLRGKHLIQAIGAMVGDARSKFQDHPYFQQLGIGARMSNKSKALPSYISPGAFSAILTDILQNHPGEDIRQRIEGLPDNHLKEVLIFLYNQTSGEVAEFRLKVEEWYNEIMDRASGAYVRKTRSWLIAIGLFLAVLFNIDPLEIYHNLSVNAALRDYVADMATDYVQTQPAPADTLATADFDAARQKINILVNENIGAISSPLGLGWTEVKKEDMTTKWWMYKIIGWLVTSLALSLGASFWFNLLRQLVNLRSNGGAPATSQATTTAAGGASFLTRPGPESPLESTRKAKEAGK
jgi:hypothetical protein